MTRLPLSVISGYLGAGKTTLINRLLAEDHGLRLLVMVNDFGAINVDEALIALASEDVIALTNGCVCCSMGADLYLALGDVLKRDDRPDHIVIEASGVADPAAIANAAIAEPQLSYAGIITLVDGLNAASLLADSQVAPQVAQQMRVADLLLLTKTTDLPPALQQALAAHGIGHPQLVSPSSPLAPLLFGVLPLPGTLDASPHPSYVHWSSKDPGPMSRADLLDRLMARPHDLYRLKGFVPSSEGMLEVHVVGNHHDIRSSQNTTPGLVGLAVQGRLTSQQIDDWWGS
ncbi:MAG: GTP-binding protein [Aestuariivita sp.]|nr:GTP-binding protein [Aestuariivita sp.]